MAEIAFILLCHKDPAAVIQQARRLTRAGDRMAVHYDARSPKAEYDKIRDAVAHLPNVTLAKRRVRCGWGEWSLVEATLAAVEAALEAFPAATHFYMLSGDCMAIKPAEYVHDYLDRADRDFIEHEDFFQSDWIKTGLKEERLIYRHLFNERRQKRLFYGAMEMAFLKRRPDVLRFFRTTWIPDETFFQTLVPHLVPADEIHSRTLTFLMFSDYGLPVTFYNDHYDMLVAQDYLFARKISPEAMELKERLGRLYVATGQEIRTSGEGKRLYTFLTSKGRVGQRFAPRFWEREATIGRERELMIVACKKWHVAKRLLRELSHHSNLPSVEYLFDEEATPLPDLGGIQSTLEKRTRHRRALMRMLFDYFETDRLVICMDPGNVDLVRDFYADRSRTRLLEVECQFSDSYLKGHARRVGLAGPETPDAAFADLLPTIRNDVVFESDRLRDQDFPDHFRIRERAAVEENAEPLAAFFGLPTDRARAIAEADIIFAD